MPGWLFSHPSKRRLAVVCVVLLASFVPARGQTNATWNGGTGNWSAKTDWSTGVVPNGNVNVFIDGPGVSAVNLDISVSVNNLTLDSSDSLAINSGGFL